MFHHFIHCWPSPNPNDLDRYITKFSDCSLDVMLSFGYIVILLSHITSITETSILFLIFSLGCLFFSFFLFLPKTLLSRVTQVSTLQFKDTKILDTERLESCSLGYKMFAFYILSPPSPAEVIPQYKSKSKFWARPGVPLPKRYQNISLAQNPSDNFSSASYYSSIILKRQLYFRKQKYIKNKIFIHILLLFIIRY